MGKMKIFMAGMPGSGKTAYIVSTWNLLAETGMDTKLYKKVGEMPEHYEKIDEISNQVLLYRKLERTKEDEDTELKIKLYDKQENEFDIDIPDLAGEIFRDLVSDRRIKKEMVVRLKESSGILFFVYYKNMSKETRIPLPAGEDGAKEQNIEDSISDKQS